jgi:hypothetical protein
MKDTYIYQLVELQSGDEPLKVGVRVYTFDNFEKAQKKLKNKIKEYKEEYNIDETSMNIGKTHAFIDISKEVVALLEIKQVNLDTDIGTSHSTFLKLD